MILMAPHMPGKEQLVDQLNALELYDKAGLIRCFPIIMTSMPTPICAWVHVRWRNIIGIASHHLICSDLANQSWQSPDPFQKPVRDIRGFQA